MKVLAIGAHPDDIELGCGGTLCKLARAGHEVVLMVLSHGERGGSPEVRHAEQIEACRRLGVGRLRWGSAADTRVAARWDAAAFAALLDEESPDLVFAHAPEDSHPDHRAIGRCAARLTSGPPVLLYEGPSSIAFTPTLYCDVRSTILDKLRAIRAHASQIARRPDRLDRQARETARFRGRQFQVTWAEAFRPAGALRGVSFGEAPSVLIASGAPAPGLLRWARRHATAMKVHWASSAHLDAAEGDGDPAALNDWMEALVQSLRPDVLVCEDPDASDWGVAAVAAGRRLRNVVCARPDPDGIRWTPLRLEFKWMGIFDA